MSNVMAFLFHFSLRSVGFIVRVIHWSSSVLGLPDRLGAKLLGVELGLGTFLVVTEGRYCREGQTTV